MATAFFDWVERKAPLDLLWRGAAKSVTGSDVVPMKQAVSWEPLDYVGQASRRYQRSALRPNAKRFFLSPSVR